ncbi:hypothetical protein BDV93DRAFT_523966 [Ceratobasidium sp. AG-I]|nr:hypothetical protein BDV93DRAFT_523966 [Ceratobasidium sp. AG-I]
MISRAKNILRSWCRGLSLSSDTLTTSDWSEPWMHISNESLGESQEKLPVDSWCNTSEKSKSNLSTLRGTFPLEIWHKVIGHATGDLEGQGRTGEFSLKRSNIGVLLGLASASKSLRRIVLEYWAHTVFIAEHTDPIQLRLLEKTNQVQIICSVRRLVCGDQFEIYRAPADALGGFEFLVELVIDGHSDIDFSDRSSSNLSKQPPALMQTGQVDGADHSHSQQTTAPRMAYRRLKVTFPKTLQTLRIYNSHVPDIYLIQKAARDCPELKALTLARCTLFTRAGCRFWNNLPQGESDAYFSNHKVAEYASAVGKELAQLPALESVQIGVYLTEHAAIKAHVEQHAGLPALTDLDPSDWRSPCDACTAGYQKATDLAEKEATEALAKAVPHLAQASWLSFFSETRTGWHTQHVLRHEDGSFKEAVARFNF